MCHVSVGHVARALEEAGIATVVIGIRAFQHYLEEMSLPRVVITPHLMGRTLARPGDREGQRAVILAACDLLEQAQEAGAVHEITCR